MILTKEQREEFKKIARPVMEYLSNHKIFHPHIKVIIDSSCAEIIEGICIAAMPRKEQISERCSHEWEPVSAVQCEHCEMIIED